MLLLHIYNNHGNAPHIHWLMIVSLTKARTLPVVVLGCGWKAVLGENFLLASFFNNYYLF